MPELCGFFNRDVEPQRLELADMAAHGAVLVAPVEVVGPELVVRHAVTHDVEGDFENLMAHGHDGLLVPAMAFDSVIPRLQRSALRVARPERALNQRGGR